MFTMQMKEGKYGQQKWYKKRVFICAYGIFININDENVTNQYIVTEWDKAYGTDHSNTYIYRFKRSNGKSAKKLATGRNPIVIGKYIYYVECRQYGDSSWKYTMDDYLDSILIYFSVVRTK